LKSRSRRWAGKRADALYPGKKRSEIGTFTVPPPPRPLVLDWQAKRFLRFAAVLSLKSVGREVETPIAGFRDYFNLNPHRAFRHSETDFDPDSIHVDGPLSTALQ
jgi:hypothetical protein